MIMDLRKACRQIKAVWIVECVKGRFEVVLWIIK